MKNRETVVSTESYIDFPLNFMSRTPYLIPPKFWGKDGEQNTEIQLTWNEKGKRVTLKFALRQLKKANWFEKDSYYMTIFLHKYRWPKDKKFHDFTLKNKLVLPNFNKRTR